MGRKPDSAAAQRADDTLLLQFPVQGVGIDTGVFEGNDPGAPLRVSFRHYDRACCIKQINQIGDFPGKHSKHVRDAGFEQQPETGVQGVDAEHIGTTAFETPRVAGRLPVPGIVVAGRLDHVPAVLAQRQLVEPFPAAVKQCHTLGPQHPFVPVRHRKIGMTRLDVKLNRANTLNCIDAK